jgi:hypothetical protein
MAIVPSADILSLNPEVSNRIFEDQSDAAFWVGKVAVDGIAIHSDYYDGTTLFRGNIYTNLGFISPDKVDDMGREIDEDDERSTQFAVIENLKEKNSSRIVGSGRVIIKTASGQPLPIEKHFPELFEASPIAPHNTEISRFIAQHENPNRQHRVALSLIRAMALYTAKQEFETDYCMIEESLLRHLGSLGLPTKQLGAPKDVEELGGELYPVGIKPAEIIKSVTTDMTGKLILRKFFESEIENGGEGYYSKSFLGASHE